MNETHVACGCINGLRMYECIGGCQVRMIVFIGPNEVMIRGMEEP